MRSRSARSVTSMGPWPACCARISSALRPYLDFLVSISHGSLADPSASSSRQRLPLRRGGAPSVELLQRLVGANDHREPFLDQAELRAGNGEVRVLVAGAGIDAVPDAPEAGGG